jgi:hypothetical protein
VQAKLTQLHAHAHRVAPPSPHDRSTLLTGINPSLPFSQIDARIHETESFHVAVSTFRKVLQFHTPCDIILGMKSVANQVGNASPRLDEIPHNNHKSSSPPTDSRGLDLISRHYLPPPPFDRC